MANKYIVEDQDVFENQTISKFTDEIRQCARWMRFRPTFTLKRVLTNDSDKLNLIIEYNGIYGSRQLEKHRFIIRINDNENIELDKPKVVTRKKYYDRDYDEERYDELYDECYEYEITKEQLQKICESNSMSIRMGGNTCECQMDDIYLCRVFYNGVYDSNQYTDAIDYLDSLKSKAESEKNNRLKREREKEEAEARKERRFWMGIVLFIIIVVMSMCIDLCC